MTFQEKFIKALEAECEAHDQDLVVNYSFSNSGAGFVQMKNSFMNQFHFTFDFQTHYCNFTFFINDKQVKYLPYTQYSKTNDVEELLGIFNALCVGGYTGEPDKASR